MAVTWWKSNREKREKIDTSGAMTDREGQRYIYVLAGIFLTSLLFIPKKLHWRNFGFVILIGILSGWSFNWLAVIIDPEFSAWMYPDGDYLLGDFGGMVGLDFLFYLCGASFVLISMWLPRGPTELPIFAVASGTIVFGISFALLDIGGALSTTCFAVPSIAFSIIAWSRGVQTINVQHWGLTGIFMMFVAFSWDLWLPSWEYRINDVHSFIWHPAWWAWTEDIPLSIMPWFTLAGWQYIYNLTLLFKLSK